MGNRYAADSLKEIERLPGNITVLCGKIRRSLAGKVATSVQAAMANVRAKITIAPATTRIKTVTSL
jgi:hypothetical protein